MANLLEVGKEESARIRVENIIRSDLNTELLEILELYCELLLARIGLLEGPQCDPGLEEAVKSLIYAAPRTDVKELNQCRQLLIEKYGKDFCIAAMENADEKVPPRVTRKLRVEPPGAQLVESYLQAIASAYDVNYGGRDDDASGGEAVAPAETDELKTMTPPRSLGPKSPISVAPPSPSTDDLNPKLRLSQADTVAKPPAQPRRKVDGNVPSISDLEKRFAQLKR